MSYQQNLDEELKQTREQMAGYLNAPESEVSDAAKLIALAIREAGIRLQSVAKF